MFIRTLLQRLAIMAALLPLTPAWAIDVEAGDYTPAPAGTTLGLLYYTHTNADSLYVNGQRQSLEAGLTTDVGMARLIHFMKLGDYIVDPQVLLPFGRLKGKDDSASLGSTSGTADAILAATIWLVNKPDTGEYFGLTPFVYAPTGSYDRNRALNLGEDRWKFAMQGGYIRRLGAGWTLDVIGDVMFYGPNSDANASGQTLKQDPSFQVQTMLRYNITQALDLRAGISGFFRGRTRLDSTTQDDRGRTWRASVGAAYMATPRTQLLATYARDLSVYNGFKENNRILLRVLQAF